jgi:hypothetical protein
MLVLELGQALGLLLFFHEVRSKLSYSVFQQLLLLGEGGEYQGSESADHKYLSSPKA